MKIIEFKKALKKEGAWKLLKKHMKNDVYLTDKQVQQVIDLKNKGETK